MTQLQKSLTVALLAATFGAVPAQAQIFPADPAIQQSQANAIIQQQNLGTQYNGLQLQQGMTNDRLREQQLFTPQPLYGANNVIQPLGANNPVFQPQPSFVPPPPSKTASAEQPAAPVPAPAAELPARPRQQAKAAEQPPAPVRIPSAQ